MLFWNYIVRRCGSNCVRTAITLWKKNHPSPQPWHHCFSKNGPLLRKRAKTPSPSFAPAAKCFSPISCFFLGYSKYIAKYKWDMWGNISSKFKTPFVFTSGFLFAFVMTLYALIISRYRVEVILYSTVIQSTHMTSSELQYTIDCTFITWSD